MEQISKDDEEVGIHVVDGFEEPKPPTDEEVEMDISDEPDDDLLQIRESVLNGLSSDGGVTNIPVEVSDSQVGYLDMILPDGRVVTLYPDHTWDVT